MSERWQTTIETVAFFLMLAFFGHCCALCATHPATDCPPTDGEREP